MYLRVTRRTNKDGSVVEYLQLAHNLRRERRPHPRLQVIHNFGRKDEVDPEALRRLAHSLGRLKEGQAGGDDGLAVGRSRPPGGAHVLTALWERLGLRTQLQDLLQEREFDSDIERVLFAPGGQPLPGPRPQPGLL